MNESNPAKSGVLFWLMLVAAGLMVGAGIALVARPLPAKYGWLSEGWIGPVVASVGFAGLVVALIGLLKRPAGRAFPAPPPAEAATLPPQTAASDRVLATPAKAMTAQEVATFLLQELERCLELLRHTSSIQDLDRMGEVITALREWGAELSLERHNLQIPPRKAKQLLRIRMETTDLHRDQLRRSGHDIDAAHQTATSLPARSEKEELEEALDRCSKRLAHVARQFHERPEIRDGLSGLAQSVGTFLGLRKRTVDPTDPALAATLKLPDLSALETLNTQLNMLKSAQAPQPAQLDTVKTYIGNLLSALGPADGIEGYTTLNELTIALHNTLDALERGEVDEAIGHMDGALSVLRKSDLLKEP